MTSNLLSLDDATFSRQMLQAAAYPVQASWFRGEKSLSEWLHPLHSTAFCRSQVVSGDVAICLNAMGQGSVALAERVLINAPVRVMNQLQTRLPSLCSLTILKRVMPQLVPLMVKPHAASYRQSSVAAALMVQAYLKLQAQESAEELERLLVRLLDIEVTGFRRTPAEMGAVLGTVAAGFFRYVASLAARDAKRGRRAATVVGILLSLNGLPYSNTATTIATTIVTVAIQAANMRHTSAGSAQAQLMAIKGELKLHIIANGLEMSATHDTRTREHEAILCNQTLDAVIDANGLG